MEIEDVLGRIPTSLTKHLEPPEQNLTEIYHMPVIQSSNMTC
jgi:hypothetical protein